MALWVKNKGGIFIPAPAGLHHSVCVDAVDLGMVDGTYGRKHMVSLAWQTKATMQDGKPYLLIKRYTASTHPDSNLRKDIESWRGKKLTDEEAEEFDLERLILVNCQLSVVHNQSKGNTYANVLSIVAAPSVLGKLLPRDYTRVKDRPGYVAPQVEEAPPVSMEQDGPPPKTDDDIPF